MSAPAPPTAYPTVFAGIKAALVAADITGKAVYTPSGLDQARVPYLVVTDHEDVTPALQGDGRTLMETSTGEVSLYQRNERDADPKLARKITAALDNHRFTVTDPDGGPPRKVVLRAGSPVKTDVEGLMAYEVAVTARHRPATP